MTSTPLSIIGFACLLVLLLLFGWSRYDTGARDERNYLIIRTDALTGCQYLRDTAGGGLTPRVDGAGHHVGCKP